VLYPSHGARQPKYRQVLDEVLALDKGERAVLTLLFLRGPQTPGELRSRTERLHAFTDLGELERALASLADREEPVVEEMERRPGQKETRWRHLLGPTPAVVGAAPAAAAHLAPPAAQVGAELAELRAELAELRAELAAAREEISRLQALLEELTAPD
jgi:hypothetical protein